MARSTGGPCRLRPEIFGAGEGGAPRTETETRVAGIWSELLKVGGIGIHDDFFDLGGDSMTAVALLAHLDEAFGVDLELAVLFDRPTIAGLVGVCRRTGVDGRQLGFDAGSAEREEFEL